MLPCYFYTSLFPAGNNEQKMKEKGNNTMRVKHSLKRLTSLLLCLVMLAQIVVVASAAGVSPASATPDPSPAADFTVNAAGAITGYSGNDDNIVIPKEINGVTIKSINAYALDDSMAANIVIPSTVTYVGSLPDSSYLEGIYFYGDCPNGIDSVLEYTYYVEDTTIYCKQAYRSNFEGLYGLNGDWEEEEFIPSTTINSSLKDPAYPEAPSHNWVYTDNGDGTHSAKCADEGCTEVITNEAHTYTGGVCVCGAKADGSKPEMFNYKVLDETAKTAAIIGYTGLGGEITLPSTYTKDGVTYTVTTVAADAFCGNGNNYSNTDAEALSKITKITVPTSITTVEARGFNYVGRYQTRAWNLKEIVFEAESVTFGASALGSNTSLTSVTLPAKQAEIASSMFSGDTALTTLTIPSSVTSIGEKAFSGCTALSEVTFKSATPPTMAVTTSYPSGTYPFGGLTEAGVSGGCGGSGATDENAWYPIYPGATPIFTFGSAVPAEAVVLTLYVKQPGEDTAEVKTYTMSQLKALATKGVIGYQHWKNGEEKLVATTEYVTLAALLADAELTFGSCDSITATADDGFASTMTHADSVTGKYYIDSEGEKTEVPAALLLTWNTGAGTLEDVADTAYFSGNLRFGYGISEDQYGTAKGNRIANKVVSLTVNVKAAHENVVTDPAVEPTEDAAGKTEGEHCEACGTVIKAQEDITATNPVVLTVKGLDKDGKAVEKMYRVNDLKALAKTGKAGYQYWKGGNEQMVAATEYVTIDDLLVNAGIDFDKGDSVKATAADGFSGTLTYADKNTLKYYIDSEGEKTEVPAILALKWNSGTGTLDEVAAAAKDTGNIRFCYGIGADQYGSAAGKRLVSNIAAVEVTYCQHTNLEPSVKENENSATCTKDGSYDEVIYCSDCGEEVSRETKTIKAPGHSWDDGVITTKPTTRKEGVKTFTCTECGATKTEAVPKLDKPTNSGSGYDPGVYKDLMDGKDDKTTDVKSQNTGDAGIALYVGLSLLSLTGGAWAVKKNRKVR